MYRRDYTASNYCMLFRLSNIIELFEWGFPPSVTSRIGLKINRPKFILTRLIERMNRNYNLQGNEKLFIMPVKRTPAYMRIASKKQKKKRNSNLIDTNVLKITSVKKSLTGLDVSSSY